MTSRRTSVLIVGGGPCGLMLANELGRRGVAAILIDQKPGTAFNPQANATQARTMEHFRRLGFADEVRAAGLPAEYPTDIAYFTRFFSHELARFELPSAAEAVKRVRGLSGSWSAAELPHRVSQKFVEAILRRKAEALPGISLHYGCRLHAYVESVDGITADIEHLDSGRRETIVAAYLVGADGPRSTIRDSIGVSWGGITGIRRDFMGGRMLAVYLRSPDFAARFPHRKAWMHVSFNPDRRAFMAAVNGRDEFAFHTQLRDGEDEAAITEIAARNAFARACGAPVACEVLSFTTWTAGHALVAERMQRGRVFIGGDAAHLFTPAGGLGYNTAIEDAVNLGWKLAAVIAGAGSSRLLDSYEPERRPVAVRNTTYARKFADSLGLYAAVPEIEDDSDAGRTARGQASQYFNRHARAEFNIPGITFGGRYDGSPVIVPDGTRPPADAADLYVPTACPGGRAPHAWLDETTSLYDVFGFDWTLLLFGDGGEDTGRAFTEAAARYGAKLRLARLPQTLRSLYEADCALVRPDQIVAWRGTAADAATATRVFGTVLGHQV